MHLALNFQRVDPARGGAETYVADLCRHLVQAGHRVDLYAESWADGCLPRRSTSCRSRRRGEPGSSGSGTSPGIPKKPCARPATIARSASSTPGSRRDHPPRRRSARQPDRQRPALSSPLVRQLYLLAKTANPKYWVHRSIESKQYDPTRQPRVVAVSNMVKRHLEQFHHVPRQQIHVVPNAIDPERLEVSQPGAVRCAFRNRLGLEPGDLVGLFAGHNFALKGLKPLLEALGARRQPESGGRPIHLLVCGGGEPGPYRRLASRLGLNETVHFLGFYPDVEDCYWSSDFFVQPTYYDPCSLVVLEALACGLPVITTAQNGASELMTDGREGYVLTAPDAADELIAALDHMTDDTARRAMSAQALRLGQ